METVSQKLFKQAQQYIPGGVNSPVRAFKAVQGEPPYIEKARGSYLWDTDGRKYTDFVCSWGPMILGHAHPRVVDAVKKAAEKGTSFGANCEIEVRMAKRLVEAVPSIQKVRMVSSGTEATMSAVRLARAYTGRDMIIKFEGCYHGHADSFLSKAGSGAMTLSIPGTPGVTQATAADTLNARYNDLPSVEKLIENNAECIAAIIVEPVAGNMGVILPRIGFLEGLRKLADQNGIVLIFDEVITGFRIGLGGAQEHFGVFPDLTTLGKIIGGGLPVGAFGGKAEIMNLLAPEGPVYQAGTLSGNPLALAAGYETLQLLSDNGFYEDLNKKSEFFFKGLKNNFEQIGQPCCANWIGSMGCFFLIDGPVVDFQSASRSDSSLYATYYKKMLDEGVYLAPSSFEAMFVSSAHTPGELEHILNLHLKVLKGLPSL